MIPALATWKRQKVFKRAIVCVFCACAYTAVLAMPLGFAQGPELGNAAPLRGNEGRMPGRFPVDAALQKFSDSPSSSLAPSMSTAGAALLSTAVTCGLAAGFVFASPVKAITRSDGPSIDLKWKEGVRQASVQKEAAMRDAENKWKESTSIVMSAYSKGMDQLNAQVKQETDMINLLRKTGDPDGANKAANELAGMKAKTEIELEIKRSIGFRKAAIEKDAAIKEAEEQEIQDIRKNEADKRAAIEIL